MVERKKGTTGFNLRAKTKTVHKGSDFELRGGGNCMLKKGLKRNFKSKAEFEVDDGFESKTNFKNRFNVKGKKKTDSQTETDDRPQRFGRNKFQDNKTDSATDDRPQRFGRNKFQDKKTDPDKPHKFGRNKFQEKKKTDSATAERPQKRKKRVIRLDPYDFTNKRMDDVIPTTITERTIEKKEEPEENKDAEISMNAQFRAIQPSPSILSFVEENLLGRRREIEFKRAGYNTKILYPLDNIPSYSDSKRARIEKTLFRNELTFFAAAKVSSSLPPPDGPEIAFAGRSNVGKSSILNALTRQWGAVRISNKPGLTQGINFFKLGPTVSLVDLPGYGFAYAKKETKEAWEELVKEYVSTRVGLKQVCLLIDTKWGMKPRDHELIDLMERSQTKYQVVLTKTDLVFPIDVARRAMQIEEELKANKSIVQPLMMVSSRTGAGIRCLRTALAKIARFAKL